MNEQDVNKELQQKVIIPMVDAMNTLDLSKLNDEPENYQVFIPYVFDEYLQSEKRIMICFQEVGYWENYTLDKLKQDLSLKGIDDFIQRTKGVFSNFTQDSIEIEQTGLTCYFDDLICRGIGKTSKDFYCTNLFKINQFNPLVKNYINERNKPHRDNVKNKIYENQYNGNCYFTIKDEIEIIKPKLVIFTTLATGYFDYLCRVLDLEECNNIYNDFDAYPDKNTKDMSGIFLGKKITNTAMEVAKL